MRRFLPHVPLFVVLTGIVGGALFWFFDKSALAQIAWGLSTVLVLVPLIYSVLKQLLRREFGVDIIALFSMGMALLFGEYLAGAVIGLMVTGGQALESYAIYRARSELSALLNRVPRTVTRYVDHSLVVINIQDVSPGDLLLIKPGEVIPVDGLVMGEIAVLDESALTGEARPVERKKGEQVLSGIVNAGSAFDLRAIATAEKSTYAGIVRLVEQAQASKAPFIRLADRFAIFFVPITFAFALVAWLVSGDPLRALAVMVVATPCPLILAAPVAFVSGISRAAKRGIIVKGGGVLEVLARAEILLLDKTGTLTTGRSVLTEVESFGSYKADDLLKWAASLDQVSPHVLAAAIVRGARERNLSLSFPLEPTEMAGSGIQGKVDGKVIALGKAEWLLKGQAMPTAVRQIQRRASLEGLTNVFLAINARIEGALILEDPIRPETPQTIRLLKRLGIKRVIMVTGDHPDLAEIVGAAIGADEVLAERSPAEKVNAVRSESARGITVMVGDGINDAPALASAHVGIAMGVRGATASSEAADVVLMVDKLDRVAEAIRISRRTKRIALQSIFMGMGLSLVAMTFAALGFLPPLYGAFLQEIIDVLVILNALRALKTEKLSMLKNKSAGLTTDQVRHEHQEMLPEIKRMRQVADRLDLMNAAEVHEALGHIKRFLVDQLIPHELEEDENMYPLISEILGGDDPTGTMSRAHLEISHLTRLFVQLVDGLSAEGPSPEELRDLRRVLYGLYALLTLHFAQEDEHYLALIEEHVPHSKVA